MDADTPRLFHRGIAKTSPVVEPKDRVESNLIHLPSGVDEGLLDAGSLNGALLAMSFRDDEGHHTTGSAVMVGPGLGLCAAHVLQDQAYIKRIQNGQAALVCHAAHDGGVLTLWTVKRVTIVQGTDLAILGMALNSDPPPSRKFGTAHITTRMPAIGETLVLCGFTANQRTQQRSQVIRIAGDVRFTQGRVTQVHALGRDRVMLPGPCIEVDCHAFAGMSGGPVFDSRGYLVGVVSSSFEGDFVTAYVSHLWPALVRGTVEPVWPAGHTPSPGTLLYLGRRFGIIIERPDAFRLVIANGEIATDYTSWT